MDELAKIIGSAARVKIMRLFLFNEDEIYSSADVAKRSRVTKPVTQKELNVLQKVGFLNKKQTTFELVTKTKTGKESIRKKKALGYSLNTKMSLVGPLRNLLIDVGLIKGKDLIQRFAKTGRIKVLVLAGVFLDEPDSMADLLIVGDNINKAKVEKTIQEMEAEIGKELRYAIFDVTEFKYRLEMYDKLVRSIFDYPHDMLVDKLGLNYKR